MCRVLENVADHGSPLLLCSSKLYSFSFCLSHLLRCHSFTKYFCLSCIQYLASVKFSNSPFLMCSMHFNNLSLILSILFVLNFLKNFRFFMCSVHGILRRFLYNQISVATSLFFICEEIFSGILCQIGGFISHSFPVLFLCFWRVLFFLFLNTFFFRSWKAFFSPLDCDFKFLYHIFRHMLEHFPDSFKILTSETITIIILVKRTLFFLDFFYH